MKRVLIVLALAVIYAGNVFAALPCERMLKKEECVQNKCATTGKACNWVESATAPGGKCTCVQPPLPCEKIVKKEECVQTKCAQTSKACNWVESAAAPGKCTCVQPPLPCEKIVKKEECVQTKCAATGKVCNWIETAAAPGGKCACVEPRQIPQTPARR
jgi:hypothetical protein